MTKQYLDYKDSGVDWLGEIPDKWNVAKTQDFFSERRERNDLGQSANYLSLVAGRGVMPYAEKGNMGNKMPEDLSKTKKILHGDFVINSMNYGIGSFGDSKYEGVCSSVYLVLTPKKDVYNKFAYLLLSNPQVAKYTQSFGKGILAHRAAIGWDTLKNIGMPLPPIETQHRIVEFLDRETASIDTQVNELEALVTLLTERRKALISETVTRGLPGEHTEFKDSGVEWLGEIPSKWDLVDPKHVFTNKSIPSFEDDMHLMASQQYGVIPQKDYLSKTGKRVTEVFSTEARFKHIDKDDFLIHLRSFQGGIEHSVNEGKVTSAYTVVSPDTTMYYPLYGKYFLKSSAYIHPLASTTNQLRDGQSIKWKDFRKVSILVPPMEEQRKIAEFLDHKTSRLDTLVSETKDAIALLKEKRKVLISDVVTGKLMVE